MSYKIAQLIQTPGPKANTTSDIFIAQPDAEKEKLAGKLFFIVEVESRKIENLKIINFLIENFNRNYYQNEKMILRERVKAITVEHIFESAVAKTNKNLAEFILAEKIKFEPRTMNATTGVIYENFLHFSSLGKNKAFLVYKDKKNLEKEGGLYKIADILGRSLASPATASEGEKGRSDKNQAGVNKMFSNVISGQIPEGGYFIFSNEALAEYLSPKQLIEIITTLPPLSAVEQIKNTLARINSYVSFLSIIIKNTTGTVETEIRREIPSSTRSSIVNLNKIEEKTEKLLTPGGHVNVQKWLSGAVGIIGKFNIFFRRRTDGQKFFSLKPASIKDKIFFKKRIGFFLSFSLSLSRAVKNFIFYGVKLIVYFFKTIFNKDKRNELAARIKEGGAKTAARIKGMAVWFKSLNKKNKILLLVGAACFVLFSSGLLLAAFKNKRTGENRLLGEITVLIEQKENQVEASLLYNNEERAAVLLGEIKELLDKLPPQTGGKIEGYGMLLNKYNVQFEKIGHVIKIGNAAEIANFSKLQTFASPENMILAAGKIYAGDSAQKLIYSLDINNNLITSISAAENGVNALKYPSLGKDNNVYYPGNGNVAQLNVNEGKIKNIPIDLRGGLDNIKTAANFNNKLYLVNGQDGQIYVYTRQGENFGPPAPWLKEKTDLAAAVSMDIDGSIYILKNDGSILKYLKGEKEDFDLKAVQPAIANPTKIAAKSESEYIYILELANKRLIVYEKSGKFLSQYKFEQLNDLKDFVVDEGKRVIYLLNGSSVYKIEATHLIENKK